MTWPCQKLELLAADEPYSFVGGPFGSRLTSRDYVAEGVPVIRGSNLNNGRFLGMDDFVFVSERKVSEDLFSNLATLGDLVFTQRGTLGQVAIIPEDGISNRYVISQSQMKLTVDDTKADTLFLYYYFSSREAIQRIISFTSSSGVPHINLTVLRNFEVPVPPLATQKVIASILSAYDDLIENNRRRIQLLEQAARLLYQEWFVHLRFPGHEHVTITDGVPEGWGRTTLGEFIDNESISLQTGPFGTQLKAADYTADGTPVINVRNIGYGTIQPEKIEFLPEQKVMALSKHILQRGDIVFGRKGAVDRHVLIGPDQDGWMQGSDCIRMRITGHDITPNLISVAFREDGHKQWMLGQCGNKATMASLNQDVISRIPIIVPSHEVLMLFDDFASEIFTQVGVLNRQAEKASLARDLLLPRLMNGEVPV